MKAMTGFVNQQQLPFRPFVMTAEQITMIEHLERIFQAQEKKLNGKADSPLHAFQRQSFHQLKQVGFPGRQHEDWKYTPVHRLIASDYQLALEKGQSILEPIPGLSSYTIPVINGHVMMESISPALTSAGVKVTSIADAMENEEWAKEFESWISESDISSSRAFELLNIAFAPAGILLHIPPHVVLDKPIEFRITHDDPEVSLSNPLFFIHGGAGSQFSLIERYEGRQDIHHTPVSGWINALGFIRLDRNASCTHLKWQDLPATQHLVYKLIIRQQRDSRLTTFAFDRGGQVVRNNVEAELDESNTYTSLQAAFLATGLQSIDHQTRINHKVPHGESHELYRGIIDDQASAAFNGKVFVHPDAQKTNAFQQNDALVLSPHAVMNSKPQLEIFADDVKCSHGATIGQMDEKALFYLQSRGIRKEEARHLLKAAFFATVIDTVTPEPLRQFVETKMVSRI